MVNNKQKKSQGPIKQYKKVQHMSNWSPRMRRKDEAENHIWKNILDFDSLDYNVTCIFPNSTKKPSKLRQFILYKVYVKRRKL